MIASHTIRRISHWLLPRRLRRLDAQALPGDLCLNGWQHREFPLLPPLCGSLVLENCPFIETLPQDLRILGSIKINNCCAFKRLPNGLEVAGNLALRCCDSLVELPDGLNVGSFLEVDACSRLSRIGARLCTGLNLSVHDCPELVSFGDGLNIGASFSISNCRSFSRFSANVRIGGCLIISDCESLSELPPGICLGGNKAYVGYELSGPQYWHVVPNGSFTCTRCSTLARLPDNMAVPGDLKLEYCAGLTKLSEGLTVEGSTQLQYLAGLKSIPSSVQLGSGLQLRHCNGIEYLPDGLACGSLLVEHCDKLKRLPSGMHIHGDVSVSACPQLTTTGPGSRIGGNMSFMSRRGRDNDIVNLRSLGHVTTVGGTLDLSGCGKLEGLPLGLSAQVLILRGCRRIAHLPDDLNVGTLEIADCQLDGLPDGMKKVTLLWRNTRVNARTAFHPELLTADEIFAERDFFRRDIMLQRCGLERFFSQTSPETIDHDNDLGGIRKLLRVRMPRADSLNRTRTGHWRFGWQPHARLLEEEAVCCLRVCCPSTGKAYFLRVPPEIETCRQAAAWLAGFDESNDYAPIVET